MNNNLIIVVLVSAVFYGTPYFFAALGELITERSGVLNLGVEGMMLIGGVSASWASQHLGGPSWLIVLLSILIGASASGLVALLHGFLCITLRVNQTVAGLAITIFAGGLGLSSYFASVWNVATKPTTHPINRLNVLGLADKPIVGPILFNQNILTYASWVLCVVASVYLFRTRIGLQLRAVGESPQTADAMGINVVRYRYVHTVIGGLLAGVGGVYYSLAIVPTWVDGMTKGAGWIAIALVIFGFWRPGLTLVGAYLFGAFSSLSVTLQSRHVSINADLLNALPFLATIVILVVLSSGWAKKRLGAPASLGVPYEREER